MRKFLPFIFACCIGITVANAAVRTATSVSRNTPPMTATTTRTAARQNIVSRTPDGSSTKSRGTESVSRGTISRGATTTSRNTAIRTINASGRTNGTAARTTTARTARAASIITQNDSKTFGTGYNTCRDAYFTCMDQFCATSDDTYRRCVCSSRLAEIRGKQRALNQSADQLQDFKDLNIAVIPKTAAEVKAMQTASEGELVSSFIREKSSSIAQLAGISSVLSSAKSKSLSTAGTLDIAGDINSIWATTDLTSGLNISNLDGGTLYSAVHSQCVNLVADRCESQSLLNMVVSAYSMYIENDCSLLATSLDKKKLSANASIRETEREMNAARLQNYDAHNSVSINECIAMVRRDVTADAACGANYVHCLDMSGLYLNRVTGEPIYTSDFYQLGSTLSLSGDVLTNQANRILVSELNRKRMFADKSLDSCRDLADEVWDEFMRQAITEIYQGQQTRIRDVRNECLDVVNQCYDRQNNSLKDFSNVKEQLLLGARLELSEELCREKLSACSNLYGGGPNGMQELLTTMYEITTQKIAQNCFTTLQEYAKQLCAVPSNDTLHGYPYACRAYAPGDQKFAPKWTCNKDTTITSDSSNTTQTKSEDDAQNPTSRVVTDFVCARKYTSCNDSYYMVNPTGEIVYKPYTNAKPGNRCVKCSPTKGCPQETVNNQTEYDNNPECGVDYAGSLYQKLVRYAVQACMRPSLALELTDTSLIPDTLLQDVNATMDLIRASMSSSLKSECERLDGYWVPSQWDNSYPEDKGLELLDNFYNETGANKKWGYCATPASITKYYTGEDPNVPENATEDSTCDATDPNDAWAGCIAKGYRCQEEYITSPSGCVAACANVKTKATTSVFKPSKDCQGEISTNGTETGCPTKWCQCKSGYYSFSLYGNTVARCEDSAEYTPDTD